MLMITLYAKQKKRHRFIEQSLDSVGECEGGMFQENTLLLITKSLVAQSFSCQLSGNKTAHLQTVWVKTTVILLSFSLLGSTGKFICCSAAIGWGWNHLKYPDDSHICHLGRGSWKTELPWDLKADRPGSSDSPGASSFLHGASTCPPPLGSWISYVTAQDSSK